LPLRKQRKKLIEETRAAEARRLAAEKDAQKYVIEAQAKRDAAEKEAEARKDHCRCKSKRRSYSRFIRSSGNACESRCCRKTGIVEAVVIEKKADAIKKKELLRQK
jgi:regulator of protease activity HflC (stomatin/prohibitin superfamily)